MYPKVPRAASNPLGMSFTKVFQEPKKGPEVRCEFTVAADDLVAEHQCYFRATADGTDAKRYCPKHVNEIGRKRHKKVAQETP
jgi:hypothetical protein